MIQKIEDKEYVSLMRKTKIVEYRQYKYTEFIYTMKIRKNILFRIQTEKE